VKNLAIMGGGSGSDKFIENTGRKSKEKDNFGDVNVDARWAGIA
jgi:hypothetical protein